MGNELWKLEGGAIGVVKDIVAGPGSAYPDQLTDVNGTLFFTRGGSLWTSDGRMPDADGQRPAEPVHLGRQSQPGQCGRDAVSAGMGRTHGGELCKSDGSADGTVLVADLLAKGASLPFNLCVSGGGLYFTATGDSHGYGLWRFDPSSAPLQSGPDRHPPVGLGGSRTAAAGVVVGEFLDGRCEHLRHVFLGGCGRLRLDRQPKFAITSLGWLKPTTATRLHAVLSIRVRKLSMPSRGLTIRGTRYELWKASCHAGNGAPGGPTSGRLTPGSPR